MVIDQPLKKEDKAYSTDTSVNQIILFFFLSLFENMQLTNQFHLNVTFLNLYFKDTLLRPTGVPAPYGGT